MGVRLEFNVDLIVIDPQAGLVDGQNRNRGDQQEQ
jgi:hypothetical protein